MLQQKLGNHPFPVQLFDWVQYTQDTVIQNIHYQIVKDKNSYYIISSKKNGVWKVKEYFSILFFLIYFISNSLYFIFFRSSFNQKVSSLYGKIISGITFMFLFFVIVSILGTYPFLKNNFDDRNYNLLEEKLKSIRIELSHKLGSLNKIPESAGDELITNWLKKFSYVFNVDIHLFNPNGTLASSSIPYMFNQGVVSEKINPIAFNKIAKQHIPEIILNEKINTTTFLSSYTHINNKNGDLLGYLNVPYFVNKETFNYEWSSFILSILNKYVVIFILFFIFLLFIGRWITKPLALIKHLISSISINENTPIDYPTKDELGDLVQLYNQKVIELNTKSKELTKAQKEIAWKEMAKQVAHEIKNPLTPMKLSVQHLSRTLKTLQTEDHEKLKKFEQTMVEQIDSLSKIAGEFADFAKMNDPVLLACNLNELLEQTIILFKSHQNVDIQVKFESDNMIILADAHQLMRALNNLLKNAIQAIGEDGHGIINIRCIEKDFFYIISIQDNGKGMSEEQIPKIFTPNFTTKSEGTGLGICSSDIPLPLLKK